MRRVCIHELCKPDLERSDPFCGGRAIGVQCRMPYRDGVDKNAFPYRDAFRYGAGFCSATRHRSAGVPLLAVLACIIYSLFASSAPSVNPNASAVNQVWTYVGEIVFNMLVLTGTIKLSDQVVKNMMGL